MSLRSPLQLMVPMLICGEGTEVVEVNFGFLWLVLVFSGPYLWGRRQCPVWP